MLLFFFSGLNLGIMITDTVVPNDTKSSQYGELWKDLFELEFVKIWNPFFAEEFRL